MLNAVVKVRRKNAFNILKEAARLSSYDEYPMLRPEVDPQIHLSRNALPQPFYLIFDKDSTLVNFTGRGSILLKGTQNFQFELVAGDHVYVPAGMPHRLIPHGEAVQFRYKAAVPRSEAVAWYCDACDAPLLRHTWDMRETLPQEGYLAACERFNADPEARVCRQCNTKRDPIDLRPFRWATISSSLRQDARDEITTQLVIEPI